MGKNYSYGVLFLLVGVAIMLGKLGVFSFMGNLFWPLFILIPGLLFHFLYFARILPSGILIPGGILTTYSILFMLCNGFGWSLMVYLWPLLIFGVAVGLFEFYFFHLHHPKSVLAAASILAIISGAALGFTLMFTIGIYFIAFGLIAIGAAMIYHQLNAR